MPLAIGRNIALLVVAFLGALSLSCAVMAPATAGTPIALPGERAFPESLTSTHDGTLFVGSLASGGVLRIRPHGVPEPWIKPGAFGTASIFGVLADERAGTLWVCSNDLSAMGLKIPGGGPGSSLKAFDLHTGDGKLSIALAGDKTLCNDIVIGPDGAAYVTNSLAPQILRWVPGGEALEPWFTDPALQPATGAGLDGLAFGSDGHLYVDSFTPGDLYRIDIMKSGTPGTLTRLDLSRPLVHPDALRHLAGNEFLVVEGGGRLDRMTVRGKRVAIRTLEDGYGGPTGVTAVGRIAWVSEGQLMYLFDPTRRDQQPHLPFQLFPVRIAK